MCRDEPVGERLAPPADQQADPVAAIRQQDAGRTSASSAPISAAEGPEAADDRLARRARSGAADRGDASGPSTTGMLLGTGSQAIGCRPSRAQAAQERLPGGDRDVRARARPHQVAGHPPMAEREQPARRAVAEPQGIPDLVEHHPDVVAPVRAARPASGRTPG